MIEIFMKIILFSNIKVGIIDKGSIYMALLKGYQHEKFHLYVGGLKNGT